MKPLQMMFKARAIAAGVAVMLLGSAAEAGMPSMFTDQGDCTYSFSYDGDSQYYFYDYCELDLYIHGGNYFGNGGAHGFYCVTDYNADPTFDAQDGLFHWPEVCQDW